MKRNRAVLCLLLVVSAIRLSAQNTIHVPADQPTIQGAISAAQPGDTVLVEPGVYYENIDFLGKAITVTSSQGASVTTIDANGLGSVVKFQSGEPNTAVLSGFTIQNGSGGTLYAGGIDIQNASPTVINNVIQNNRACHSPGVYMDSSSAIIQGNKITGNVSGSCSGIRGGGIYAGSGTAAQIIGNYIVNNTVDSSGGGIELAGGDAPVVRDNVITGNVVTFGTAGGLGIGNVDAGVIDHNLLFGNSATRGATELNLPSGNVKLTSNTIVATSTTNAVNVIGTSPQLAISNNVFYSTSGPIFNCQATNPLTMFSNNDVFSAAGSALYSSGCPDLTGTAGNVSADPAFANVSTGDFHLLAGSPAIDSGANAGVLATTDLDGNSRILDGNSDQVAVVDLGAYEWQTFGSFSPSMLHLGVSNVGSSANPVSFTFTASQTLQNVTFLSKGDFSATSTCPAQMDAGMQCTVSVTFTPSTWGVRSGAVSVMTSNYGTPVQAQLTGIGVSGRVSLNPTSLSFGGVPLGANATLPVTITNAGNTPLAIMSATAVDSAGLNSTAYAIANQCPATLDAGANCVINVTFIPTNAWQTPATLQIYDSAAGMTHTVPLSGKGLAPVVSFSPNPLFMGSIRVGTSTTGDIYIFNNGNADLSVSGMAISGPEFSITGSECPATLAPSSYCKVSVTFTPATVMNYIGTLIITDNTTSGTDRSEIRAGGTGPLATLSATTVTIQHQVGQGWVGKSVLLTNTGQYPLNISSMTISDTTNYALYNQCPSVLNAGAQCNIGIGFLPQHRGTLPATVTIVDDSAGSPTQTISVTGTATAPSILFTPGAQHWSNVLVNTTATAPMTITNNGELTLNISSIAAVDQRTNPPGNEFAQTNNCPASLTVGASCTVNVSYTPDRSGTSYGYLQVQANTYETINTADLTSTAVAPFAFLSPTTLPLGSVIIGQNTTRTVTLQNVGAGTMTISSVADSGAPFSHTTTCGSNLEPNAFCTIAITFSPTTHGMFSGTVTVTDNATGSPHMVAVNGTGVAPALNINPGSVNFPSTAIGTRATVPIALSNPGDSALTITNMAPSGAPFSLVTDCGSSLAAGGSCTIFANFTPAAHGTFTGTITITDNADGSPHSIALTGQGVAPIATLSTPSVNFNSVAYGASSMTPVTLTNTGDTGLNITSITANAPFSQTNNCGTVLQPNVSCVINTTFTPVGRGVVSGTLMILDNANGGTQVVALNGTGVAPVVYLSPASLTFGNTIVGASSATQNFTLSNTGDATLNISGISVSGDFNRTTTCGSSLPALASCTVSVTFVPSGGGTRTGAVVLTDNAIGGTQNDPLTGNGLDFSLTASSQTASVKRNGSTSISIILSSIGGTFPNSVSLACSGLVNGATCKFTPGSIAPGTTTSTLTITTKNNSPLGTFVLAVNGTSGSLIRATAISVNVQ